MTLLVSFICKSVQSIEDNAMLCSLLRPWLCLLLVYASLTSYRCTSFFRCMVSDVCIGDYGPKMSPYG